MSVDRLLAEARVTSRLESDHIVQVLDAGVDIATSAVFVVMELLSGVTLQQRVDDQGPCTPEETVEFVRQIATGLDKAHRYVDREGRPTPVVHRDLKPTNLFLTRRDDGSALVKILDFGAAKVLSPSTHASGVIRGTPQYMASEQASGEPSSPATDIWALGLIAFFLLTRKSYWLTVERGGSQVQLFAEILSLPLVPASERARVLGSSLTWGAGFDAWFAASVNRESSRRFASAPLAARELSRALGVAARPVQVSARTLETLDHAAVESVRAPPATRRNRARVVLSTLGIVLAGGGVATATLWKRWSSTQTEASAVPSESVPPAAVSAGAPPSLSASAAKPASSASAERPSQPVTVTAPAASAPTKTDKSVKKRSLPNGAPSATEKPKAPPRDVYEQR